jgi:VanZ family protein
LGINPDNQTSTKINTIASIRFLYIAVYLISSWLPFELIFDLRHIMAKMHPDKYGQCQIILDPFFHFRHWNHDADIVFGLFWGVLPLGVLTAVLNAFKNQLNVFRSMFVCLMVTFVSETGQIFVLTRTTDIVMIFLSCFAGLIGWLSARFWFMLQDSQGYSTFENEKHRNDFLFSMIILYILLLFVAGLSPFRFELSIKAIFQKLLYQSNWIPFHNQIGLRNIEMSFWLLKDVGAFIPLGLLMTFYGQVLRPSLPRIWVISLVVFLGLGIAAALEIVKTTGVGQYGDVTSILLGFIGTLIGSVFLRFFIKTNPPLE